MAEANWYVVHTYSGYENKVKADIEKTIENRHLEDEILEVRIPMQDVVEMKNGAKKQVQKKMFPGYVLISASVSGTGFDPGPTNPVTPLVFLTTYHVSSFITILMSTYPGNIFF